MVLNDEHGWYKHWQNTDAVNHSRSSACISAFVTADISDAMDPWPVVVTSPFCMGSDKR